jgi:hypothetical protein
MNADKKSKGGSHKAEQSRPEAAAEPVDKIFHRDYIPSMEWEVEYTDEFEGWWQSLDEEEQNSVAVIVGLLVRYGPLLGRPFADKVKSSRHANMKELRI